MRFVQTKWIVADVSLVVGFVGVGVLGAYLIAPMFKPSAHRASFAVVPAKNGVVGTFARTY